MSKAAVVPALSEHQKNYNGIDLVKFICAFLVFCIHVSPLNAPIGETLSSTGKYFNFGIQQYLSRLAVPFYFVSAGFFLFRKMSPDRLDVPRIKDYCFKILRLVGAWSVLLFVGGTAHLWYLGASVVAVAFISLCLHWRVKPGLLICITLFLYAIGMLFDSYFGFFEPLLKNTAIKYIYALWNMIVGKSRNGLFMGSIFILMGMFFSQGKIRIKFFVSLLGFILSMVCLLGEVYFLKSHDIPKDYNMYLFLLPSVFFLFALASSIQLKDRSVYTRLRIIGLLVYFIHLVFNFFVSIAVNFAYKLFLLDLMPYRFLLTIVPTVLAAVLLERLAGRKRFGWIKWFLS